MKVRFKQEYTDYREAHEAFRKACEKGTAYLIYDFPTKTWTLETFKEVHGTPNLMREMLAHIYIENDLPHEQADALAYADSAIKTLIDMGVLQ